MTDGRNRRSSSQGMEALDLDQAKAIQDSSISALESKAQSVIPPDSEKASPTYYPKVQLAAP